MIVTKIWIKMKLVKKIVRIFKEEIKKRKKKKLVKKIIKANVAFFHVIVDVATHQHLI